LNGEKTEIRAGKSSFGLIDAVRLFEELDLQEGIVLLDAGSGRGEYALAAAQVLRDEGLAYAMDLREDGIASLQAQVAANGSHLLQGP
jgi:cyclopropane fatty-acyl-phospholipid synthase-like methyltransferase